MSCKVEIHFPQAYPLPFTQIYNHQGSTQLNWLDCQMSQFPKDGVQERTGDALSLENYRPAPFLMNDLT